MTNMLRMKPVLTAAHYHCYIRLRVKLSHDDRSKYDTNKHIWQENSLNNIMLMKYINTGGFIKEFTYQAHASAGSPITHVRTLKCLLQP